LLQAAPQVPGYVPFYWAWMRPLFVFAPGLAAALVRHILLPDKEMESQFLRCRTTERVEAWASCGASAEVLS
jgi:hypothetical protein